MSDLPDAAEQRAAEALWKSGACEPQEAAALASQVRAQFPADHPKGAMASFADYLRVLGDAADGAHTPGGVT